MSSSTRSNSNRLTDTPLANGRRDAHRVLFEILAVVTVSLISLTSYFHLPITDADEGILACGAERILRGQVPYRDFFSELGPVSFYLQALIFKLSSIDIVSLRLTAWLLGGATTGLLYILARKILRPWWAVAATAAFPLVCYPLVYRVSHHWWANLFQILTLLALGASLEPQPGGRSGSRATWCGLAGALAGVTILTMQSKGFWATFMGLLFLLCEPGLTASNEKRRIPIRRVLAFLTGCAIVLGAMAGYLATHGALRAWIDANFTFLFTNYRPYQDVPQGSAVQTLLHLGGLAFREPSVHLSLYFMGYVFFFLLAPAVAFGGGVARLIASRRQALKDSSLFSLMLFQGAAGFLSEAHSPDIGHLIWGSPLVLILIAYQWERLTSGARLPKRVFQMAGVGVIALMLFVAARKAIITARIDGPVETRRGVLYVQPEQAAQTQARINAIERRVPPGGETFFYPYMAEIYFLTATRNPTGYDVLLSDFHRPTQIEEAIASIRRARPPYVFGFDRIQVLTIRPHFPDDPPDMVRPHPVGRALANPASGYHLEVVVEDMEVWATKP